MRKFLFVFFFLAQNAYSSFSFSLPELGVLSFQRYILVGTVLNRQLRNRDMRALQSHWVHNLDLGLQLLPRVERERVYRAEKREQDFLSSLSPGGILEHEGYVSTSSNPDWYRIAGASPNVLYVIKERSGKRITQFAPPCDFYDYGSEQEILIPRLSRFKILSIDTSEPILKVFMEELEDPAKDTISDREFRPLEDMFF